MLLTGSLLANDSVGGSIPSTDQPVRAPMLAAVNVAEQKNVGAPLSGVTKHTSAVTETVAPSALSRDAEGLINFVRDDELTGWEFVNPEKTPLSSSVTMQPSVLSVTGKPIGYLQTTASYADYQLHAEWRWTDKPGNGGVLVHISGGPVDRNLWPVCFQIQTKHTRAGDLLPMAGAKFSEPLSTPADAKTPVLNFSSADSEKPAGEWNNCDIVCRGGDIEVRINGILQNHVTQCTPAAGAVGFQLEGTPFELREIWIKPLH